MSKPVTLVVGRGGSRPQLVRRGRVSVLAPGPMPREIYLLAEYLPTVLPARILCARDSAALVALTAASEREDAHVVHWTQDAYAARAAAETVSRLPEVQVRLEVTPNLPSGPFDLVTLPLPHGHDALVARDLLEQAHDALAVGGQIRVSTDRAHQGVQRLVKETFGSAELPTVGKRGAIIMAHRTRIEPIWVDRTHPVTAPWRGIDYQFSSRPGIFSHGRLDGGTKALLEALEPLQATSILDLGCGSGMLGLLTALGSKDARVVLVDSNALAVELAERNAKALGLERASVLLRADLEDIPDPSFDLVVANPPYFSRGRIASSFMATAARCLKDGGRFLMVAKSVEFHIPLLEERFLNVDVKVIRGYGVFTATEPRMDHPEQLAPLGESWSDS